MLSRMFDFWNNTEVVTRLYHVAAIGLAVCTAFGVVFGIQQYRLNKKDREETQKELEQSSKRVAELERKQKRRTIPAEIQDKLARQLKGFDNPKITITINVGDEEAMWFAADFKKIFEAAGWQVDGVIESSGAKGGLRLMVHSIATAPAYAEYLQRRLEESGFKAEGEESNNLPEDSLILFVGAKK
jgi:hypothetical protein